MGGQGSGGRNAKPTRLHVLGGTYRRDRHGHSVDAAPLVDVPEPPGWLEGEALAEWHRVAPDLVKLGVLARLDIGALAAYCASVALWRQASATVTAEGFTQPGARGGQVTHPAARTMRAAEQEMRRWAAEFGLTPASRSRLGVAMPSGASGGPERLLTNPTV